MIKKLFYAMMAGAMLLATSCEKGLDEVATVNETATVSFNIGTPEIATRAYGDGTTANKLQWAVYDIDGDVYTHLAQLNGGEDEFNGSKNVSLELGTGNTYQVVFWAAAEDAPYSFNPEAKKLVVDYNNTSANNENLDAFYASVEVRVSGAESKTVELKRPFAQLNIGANDYEYAGKAGIVPIRSKIETYAYPEMDLIFGNVIGDEAQPVTFDSNVIANGLTANVEEEEFKVSGNKYLAMAYLLVGEKETVDVTFSYTTESGKNFSRTVGSVPVERNYRTNIYGKLLTSSMDVNVEIKPGFGGENNVEPWDGESTKVPAVISEEGEEVVTYGVTDGSELAYLAALVNGSLGTRAAAEVEPFNIKLTGSIDLGGHEWTPIGYNPNDVAGDENYFTGTFDGNGYTISNLKINVTDKGGVGLFGAVHNATFKNFTLKNVDIKAVESESNPANTSGAEGKINYIAGGHIGAIAGYDAGNGTVSFENVHVEGLIKIEGETRAAQGQRIGGIIGGRASSKYSFKNVSVCGDEGSYIKGYCSTAGVIGHNQEAATFEQVSTDIDVYAVTFGAGGIAGIARQSSTFTSCSSKGDITLDASQTQLSSYSANYPYRVGGIVGCWSDSKNGVITLTNCSFEGTLTSIDKDGNSPASFDYLGYVGRGYGLKNCAGSTVNIDGIKFIQKYDDKYGIYDIIDEEGRVVIFSKDNLQKDANGKYANVFDKNVILLGDLKLSANETAVHTGYGKAGVQVVNGAVLDGNGKTLTVTNAGATWDCAIYTNGGTIKNLTVAGAMRGIFMGGATADVFIENVTFKNVIYTFNSDGGNSDFGVYLNGCTINGWTSHSDVHKEVVYTNCSFGEGSGYAFCRPYGPTSFVNCDFCEGYEIQPLAAVSFENCTIDGQPLTADNIATLVPYNKTVTVNGVDYQLIGTPEALSTALTSEAENIAIVLTENIDLPISSLGQQTGGSGEYKLGGENTKNITIDLAGNKLNITTTYWSVLGAKNDNAVFTIKNGTMTSSQTSGTWNSYDLCFANCNYNFENVVFEKAIALEGANKSYNLTNVSITETNDYYAIWVSAKGQNITINGLTIDSAGRGVKIDDQYVSAPAKVTVSVANATFNTVKKAAVVVKSVEGAEINWGVGNNISNVAADSVNPVWVDTNAAAYADQVTVNGASCIVEK